MKEVLSEIYHQLIEACVQLNRIATALEGKNDDNSKT